MLTKTYLCPDCKAPLYSVNDEKLRCNTCPRDWSVENGIPILTDNSIWYPKEHLSKDEFEKFFINIEKHGYENAVEIATQTMGKPKTFKALAFDEARRNLSDFLPTNKNAVVLDYGCGVGSISFNMANSCKHVYSIDQSPFRAKFIKARAKGTNVTNITPLCSGSARYLPFPDNSFDIIIMNGVLEWMPLASEGNPHAIQMNALKEMNRVLKKGGLLYLSIENRFGYRYILQGKGDSHNQKKRKIKYITALPRFMANIYSYCKIGAPYRCFLYSYNGYVKLFQLADFNDLDFYFPYPDHNNLDSMIPLKDKKTTSFGVRQLLESSSLNSKERKSLKFMDRLNLTKFMAQDYSILAKK